MFEKVLIANRGEIACRVIRACHVLGLQTVAVYSKADRESRHVSMADEAICIGEGPNMDSYLNLPNVLMAIEISGAQAVHPGFGYFSENARFAEEVALMGVKFIGPPVGAIRGMGDKDKAKRSAIEAGCPVVPGSEGAVSGEAEAAKVASEIGYPVLLKAVAGGGGRGIRRVNSEAEIAQVFKTAQQEAAASFGNDDMLVEKFVIEPRHVEMQLLGDEHGTMLYLGERECSVQNLRHQKIVEEAPCASLTPEARKDMGEAAVRVARSVGYTNAGTVEFLLDRDGKFYFLEMNTRIQVEHPVTELVTGLDIVAWQIRIAAGERLPIGQEEIACRGHAIEARITAQDPDRDFAPSAGKVTVWNPPGFANVRLDTHVTTGFTVAPFYDPMIAKLIVWGENREAAVRLLQVALREFEVEGIQTNIPFLIRLTAHPDYVRGDVSTAFVPNFLSESPVVA
ncbi:MAG: acetyl-CoA carboxylase biotin carboxylase subunit [Fimbriimonadaceae bacterium]|nr:acetyl-CoA carboxylase biotin carboxylase subunit [Fimbriimonadaceae bacterium]QYK57795.1 MAG: acetyl-CoA carboxylase biotin carboxylase subunit [Fimbriimonadaceae bacterium]